EDAFRLAVVVGIRRVEHGDPAGERTIDDAAGLLLGGPLAEVHGADDDRGLRDRTGAQPGFHPGVLTTSLVKVAGDLLKLDDTDQARVRLDPVEDVEAADVDLQERAPHRVPESARRGDRGQGVGNLFEDCEDLSTRPFVDDVPVFRELDPASHSPSIWAFVRNRATAAERL